MAKDWFEHLDSRQAELRAEGLARELKIRGRNVVSFASNDYLGLSSHPLVVASAKQALDEFGAGATASPLICGYKTIHQDLSAALAAFKNTETALIFPSGYHAALATLGALADGDAAILLDKLAHASLIDGARLSGARVRTFHHNDAVDLARLLAAESARRCVIVIESLYSMDGDTAPIVEMLALTERHGALLLVDEAHATGVLGENGRGLLSGIAGGSPRVIALGTLSKALGAQGGFVCAPARIIQTIVMGRAHMFSTALAPASAATALAALKLVDAEPERRTRLAERADYVRGELARMNYPALSTQGPIVPALIGDEKEALSFSEKLLASGFHVPAVRYPTVKKGEARLRISLSAAHSQSECEQLLDRIKSIQLKITTH